MTADIDKALMYQVTHDAGVIAIISTRFTPIALPQTAVFPAAVYQEISGVPIGVHNEASILPRPRIQITCWGLTFADVVAADKAIKIAIDGISPYVTMVEACQAASTPHDDRDPTTELYQRSRDYMIMWKE